MRSASIQEKKALIKDVFGEVYFGWSYVYRLTKLDKETVIRELSYLLGDLKLKSSFFVRLYEDDSAIAVVKFWNAPKTLMRRHGVLRKGWLVTPTEVLLYEFKSRYQRKIETKIISKIAKDEYSQFKPLANSLLEYWKKKRNLMIVKKARELPEIKGVKLYEREDLWPPCMRVLLARLRATGYLQHGERLQLGLFLKKLGMPVDEQMKFWYKFAVDNVGMSWEEFERKGGYYIKHIYGLVGSKKDYNAPKCDTIIAKYFCAFRHLTAEELKEYLKSIYNVPKKLLGELLKLARDKSPKKACTMLLSFLSGKKIEKDIQHPLQFVRIMYYSTKKGGKNKGASSNASESSDVRDKSEGSS